jgi:CheY-like chemotaxis protein
MIEVRTSGSETPARIAIEITDQGVGIAEEKLDRIFDAFEQGARQSQAGLGLGLAICKALVEMHGGEISARSAGVNRGASFVVQLPCSSPASAPSATPSVPPPPRTGVRVLVVEDHEDTLNTLRRLLERRGYVVRIATSVAQALEVAGSFEFDVLVSDIGLPDGRGTELLERLGELRGSRPPSIAMSGYGMEDDLERSRDAGFSEHLTKPVEFAALQQAIARLASDLPPVSEAGS